MRVLKMASLANQAAKKSQHHLRVACAQMTAVNSHASNLRMCDELTRRAACESSCDMVLFPEACAFLGESTEETVRAAQDFSDSRVVDEYKRIARSHGVWLSCSVQEKSSQADKVVYNTQLMIDNKGEIQAKYRKVHLFDVDVKNGPVLRESSFTLPGSELVTCKVSLPHLSQPVCFGLTTCYDLRFPEMYQKLRYDHGAHVLLVPSAFTKVTGKAHWHTLLKARSIENQCYTIAAAQAGRHSAKRESYGHSLIIDPWGSVVAECTEEGEDVDVANGSLAVADIDLDFLNSVRERMPVAEHRLKGQAMLRTKA